VVVEQVVVDCLDLLVKVEPAELAYNHQYLAQQHITQVAAAVAALQVPVILVVQVAVD
jgi:hypothetical protein